MMPLTGGSVADPQIAYEDPTYSSTKFTVHLSPGTNYFVFREVGHNCGGGGVFVKIPQGSPPVGGELLSMNISNFTYAFDTSPFPSFTN